MASPQPPSKKMPEPQHLLEKMLEMLPDVKIDKKELAWDLGKIDGKVTDQELAQAKLYEQERTLHTALLLSMYAAVHNVTGKDIITTPLFGITYTPQNHLKFELLEGIAPVPHKQRYTISSLDMIFACHARDMPLIWEGDTGVGKTITEETYLRTILPPESFVVMSLGHQSFTDSPKAPFERAEMVQGMPVTKLDWENLRKIAAMYIDEINLGNPNDLLQLSYARVLTSHERGVAGIIIPTLNYETGKIEFKDQDKIKRTWASGSQNPPKTRDAQFSGIELTASMKNRFLILSYPKIIRSAGSSLWMLEQGNGLHHTFLQKMSHYLQSLANISIDEDELREKWLDIYAYTLDSARTEKMILKSTLEFADIMLGSLCGSLADVYRTDHDLANSWKEKIVADLGAEQAVIWKNFVLTDTITDTQDVQKLQAVVNSFGKPITERDDANVKSLADLFATIKALKAAFSQKKPLDAYLQAPTYITVEDVAAATTLLTRNKQTSTTTDPVQVVNTMLQEYVTLHDAYAKSQRFKIDGKDYDQFEITNRNLGLKFLTYTSAARGAASAEDFVKRLSRPAEAIQAQIGGSNIKKYIIQRTLTDLATVAGFVMEHREEIDGYLKKNKDQTGENLRYQIQEIYKREQGNPTFSEIYAHRLPRVI